MNFKLLLLFGGLLLFINTEIYGQESPPQVEKAAININGLEDLKAAIKPATLFPVLQAMDTWMPKLVSTTNWQTELSNNLVLNYYIDHSDTNDVLFESFLTQSDSIIKELDMFFEMAPSSKGEHLAASTRLICFIIKTKTDLTFGTLPDPHLLFYYLDPVRDPNYMTRFRHEYAHWVFGRVYGEAPSLFYEGVATFAEKRSDKDHFTPLFPSKGLEVEDIPSLSRLAKNETFWNTKNNYTISSLFVNFLVSEWGWEKLKLLFLESDYDDPQIHEHFKEIYGSSLKEMDDPFKEFLKNKTQQPIL